MRSKYIKNITSVSAILSWVVKSLLKLYLFESIAYRSHYASSQNRGNITISTKSIEHSHL
jgi:hypothetical protein